MFALGIAVTWGLSQAALDAYAHFYYSVPAGAPHGAQIAVDFNKRLDKAVLDSMRFGVYFVVMSALSLTISVFDLWKAFDAEELDHEIALHEEHRRQEHSETTS
jgi:hypothetical protein